jgi:hypothetical protein
MFEIAPCSHEAAKFAVMNWHYSQKMPSGKLVKFGVWENEKFIGAVIYGRGANNRLLNPYGLQMTEGCELVRVALTKHTTPVSQIVAATMRDLKVSQPGLRLIVSFADPEQGHRGGIYQAMNWTYAGKSQAQRELVIDGKPVHKRTASAKYGTASPERITNMTGKKVEYGPIAWKYVYLYPLDKQMRRKISKLSNEYPHAVEGSIVSRVDSFGEV